MIQKSKKVQQIKQSNLYGKFPHVILESSYIVLVLSYSSRKKLSIVTHFMNQRRLLNAQHTS